MRLRHAAIQLLALAMVPAAAMRAQTSPAIPRWSAGEVECPGGTELRRAEAPDGSRSAMWCEAVQGTKVARHGPYLELYADGSTARQGIYLDGVQAGLWVSWTPAGAPVSERVLLPGEAGRHILQPEDLCPPGSTRDRSHGHDHRRRMWSRCYAIDKEGERVLVGPYVTWDEEKGPNGGKRYLLRAIMTYENDQRHGPHRLYEGPFRGEVLVEEETYSAGQLEGDSRAYYSGGSLRELRSYRDGQLDGERAGYYPDGTERWRVVYDQGRRVAAEGDLSVAGQPCPEHTVPTASADGLKEFCARRRLHFLHRDGAFVERDETGRVVESGLYKNGKKVELWQVPLGVELPPEVSDDAQVAAIQLMIGERPFLDLSSPPPPEETAPDLEPESPSPQTAFDIWFRDRKTRKYPSPRTVVEDGVVKVYGLSPGSYYMKVEIDAEPSNGEQRAGDLFSSSHFEVVLGEVTQSEAQLLHSLHLTEPWDNVEDIPGGSDPCNDEEALLPRLPRFAWQPPAGEDPAGIEYSYKLSRWSCDPRAKLGVMVDASTFETSFEIALPPTRRGEVYEFSLIAKRGEKAIGQMMTFHDGAYGWSLRFRVE